MEACRGHHSRYLDPSRIGNEARIFSLLARDRGINETIDRKAAQSLAMYTNKKRTRPSNVTFGQECTYPLLLVGKSIGVHISGQVVS